MITKAQRYAELLGRVPFVEKVSLTGSLAEGRGTPSSDIDFFVQVSRGRLYVTRLLATVLIHLLGVRRHGDQIAGRICLNWFATFDGPARQGRVHQVLWQRSAPHRAGSTVLLERALLGAAGNLIETILKQWQQARFRNDPRTHQVGSHVRFSDEELGFHPPKGF